ncbi:MAG TPA: protein kinase [Pyrinomonadaceae bacterium]|nr:protein kinase [Pyrinomonadaceae bacterium]
MNDWQRVRAIFDDALRHPPADRSRYVVSVCGDDVDLQREVDSLLKALDSAELFLETPAMVQVVENSLGPEPRLSRGEMLQHYEVRELLGSGGMGEVYLARDTRLNRNVAIKVLRVSFLSDPQAGRRLLREARAAALLEHPNICQIYEISESDEHNFIVMPHVVGTTLADVIADGGLSTGTALDYATQIVDGLAEAHRNGVIHRDIKPANVIVSDKGQVKILDFGLAKFIEAESSEETAQRLNTSGAVMGTVPYMSPEQLKAKPVDARTDIFSVGSLLYEMLTAKPAFNRDTNAETISSILKDEPDWSHVPEQLAPILKRCLAKDVSERYQTSDDLLDDLREAGRVWTDTTDNLGAAETVATPVTETGGASKKRHLYFWQSGGDVSRDESIEVDSTTATSRVGPLGMGALVLAIVITGAAGVWIWRAQRIATPNLDSLKSVRLTAWRSGAATSSTNFRISHDGKTIAYSSSQTGESEAIYIKQISGGEEFQVTKDEFTNVSPLWSPDDQRIAFVSVRESKPGIYMSHFLGGVVTPLRLSERANIVLRHWGRNDDSIYYEQSGNLFRLDLASRAVAQITQLPDEPRNTRYFSLSPDETRVVYCDERGGQIDLWMTPVNGGKPIQLTNDVDGELYPVWHPDGARILYNVFRNGLAQIDLISSDGGSPVQITRGDSTYVLIGLSPQGDKIYYSSTEKKSDIASVAVDSGRESEVTSEPDLEFWGDISPDGKSFVYHLGLPHAYGKMFESPLTIRTSDGGSRRLAAKGLDAHWLPDGRSLSVLRINEANDYEVWLVDTVTGEERKITREDVMTPAITPMPLMRTEPRDLDFSPDSEHFVYVASARPQNAKIGSIDTGEVTNLTKNEDRNVTYSSPTFSPSGSQVALLAAQRSTDKTQKTTRGLEVVEGDAVRNLYSTTDSVRLIGWSNETELVLATVPEMNTAFPMVVNLIAVTTNGSVRKLFTLNDALFRTLNISRDGNTLIYVARNNDREDVWTVSLRDGTQPKQVTFSANSRVFLANLAFSPDGKTIYFDKQEEINTISMFENFN